jgi:hypothetical protein
MSDPITVNDICQATDRVELDRTMDGNILRAESFESASLGKRGIRTYDDAGRIVREQVEDI